MRESRGTTKGLFFTALVEAVRRDKGAEGIEQLTHILGVPPIFAPFSDYPEEQLNALLKATAQIRYGDQSDKSFSKLGALCWDAFKSSSIGKAALNLVGNKFSDLAFMAQKLYDLGTTSGERSVTAIGPHHVQIHFAKEDSPAAFHEGIILGAGKSLGAKLKTAISPTGPHTFIIDVQWE